MPSADAWARLAQECPRRIIAALHRSGEYHHGTAARFPGKVLCCHHDAPLPEDWAPTEAQERAWQMASGTAPALSATR